MPGYGFLKVLYILKQQVSYATRFSVPFIPKEFFLMPLNLSE